MLEWPRSSVELAQNEPGNGKDRISCLLLPPGAAGYVLMDVELGKGSRCRIKPASFCQITWVLGSGSILQTRFHSQMNSIAARVFLGFFFFCLFLFNFSTKPKLPAFGHQQFITALPKFLPAGYLTAPAVRMLWSMADQHAEPTSL